MSERETLDAWRDLYRFAISSYFIDPFSEEIFPGEGFRLRYQCENSLLTGSGFLSHEDYDVTIGGLIRECRELYAIEVPTYVSVKVTNSRVAKHKCCDWDDFYNFQTRKLFENGLHLGLAVFDDSREWVLVKDPDIAFFLVVEPSADTTK